MEKKKEKKTINDIMLIPVLAIIVTILMWGCNALIPFLIN